MQNKQYFVLSKIYMIIFNCAVDKDFKDKNEIFTNIIKKGEDNECY